MAWLRTIDRKQARGDGLRAPLLCMQQLQAGELQPGQPVAVGGRALLQRPATWQHLIERQVAQGGHPGYGEWNVPYLQAVPSSLAAKTVQLS